MNTALKYNVYHLHRGDNESPKSRQQIKKELLLDKLSKAIRLKHYSKATERAYAGYVAEFIDFRIDSSSQEHGAKAIEEYLTWLAVKKNVSYLFPQATRWVNEETGEQGRPHIHPTAIQKAVKSARIAARIYKHVTPHTFRHSYATHLLEDGETIRTVQELLGHKSVKTTMIYTHVMQKKSAVRSPLDRMFNSPK